ncbi:MAG: hypothetical protein O3B84_07475, partial [Chloroflexi bacterium]|nr:hypothetical protein [Chloroflexota bacterium]
MDSGTADEASVLAAVDAVGAARTAVKKEHVKARLEVRGILGEETMARIKDQVKTRMKERMQDRRNQGRGQGDGPPRR